MRSDMAKDETGSKIENNILKGNEVSFRTEYTSLGQFVLDTLENSADFVGGIDAVSGEEHTYEKMRERSVRCALWMRTQGLLPGDVVTICSHNHLDIATPFFAALYLGVVTNPLDTALTPEEIIHLMRMTKPKMAFVSEDSVTTVVEAAKKAEIVLKIVVFGQVTPGFFEFESILVEANFDEVKRFECAPIKNPNQTATVMCTSGTTGLSKGVALSHEAMLLQLFRTEKLGMAGNKCLTFSSLYWNSGTRCMFMNLFAKVTTFLIPHFEEHAACEIMEEHQISWIYLSSPMINRLLKSGALERYDLSRVKRVCYGGAPLGPRSREAFAKFVPNALVTMVYALTEIAGVLSTQSANSKPGSSGQIVENAQLKVVEPETGRTLGANEPGELLIKSTGMMSFYCDNAQATAEALDEEGWLHTGDLGYYDEDGEIFVVERLNELIKCRGNQLSGFEIESVIMSHPGVKDVAVIGLPHPADGEHPVAFVVKTADYAGEEVTDIELMELVATELSDTKRLRGGVRFSDCLPKSPSNKVRRNILRALAANSVKKPH